jgi:hypothetical protein
VNWGNVFGKFADMMKKRPKKNRIPKGEMIWLESSLKLPHSSSSGGSNMASSFGHSSSSGSKNRAFADARQRDSGKAMKTEAKRFQNLRRCDLMHQPGLFATSFL